MSFTLSFLILPSLVTDLIMNEHPYFLRLAPQNHREVDKMGKGSSGAVRVDDANGGSTLTYGRQFSADSGSLYSSITRETINALKAHFRDQV